jgi:DNA-binding response OmpR family regulator
MSKYKILLIEDDQTMLILLRTLLSFEGYDVAQLENDDNLDVIMDAVRQEMPEAILLDVNLRQVNGLDLLQRIRQDDSLDDVRVIMSSGLDFSARCLSGGADAFIQKPYMPEELIRKIREAVEKPTSTMEGES